MPRPGVDVKVSGDATFVGNDLDSSQTFLVGVTERGLGSQEPVRSFEDYKKRFGTRTAEGQDMYDAARAFFEEGGTVLFVNPVQGAGGDTATGLLGTLLVVNALGAGAWGNAVRVSTVAPTGLSAGDGVILEVEMPAGNIVERSYELGTVADALAWIGTYSNMISATVGAVAEGVEAPMTEPLNVTLATGADADPADEGDFAAALSLFDADMGPGQFYAPGERTQAELLAVAAAIAGTQRVGLWDLPNSADPNDIAGALAVLQNVDGANNMLAVGPRLIYPHETAPATILVPGGGVEAGIIARVDKLRDRSLVAAGSDGISRRALGLGQTYSDADRTELNALGAALFKSVNNSVRMYGYRTSAGPTEKNWMFFQESRVVMQLAYDLDAMMEEYVLKTIDGRKVLQTKVNVAATGVCTQYWRQNALYGESATEAFQIDTDNVNNTATAMAGEVHLQAKVKTSRVAEWIEINLVKTMLDRPF